LGLTMPHSPAQILCNHRDLGRSAGVCGEIGRWSVRDMLLGNTQVTDFFACLLIAGLNQVGESLYASLATFRQEIFRFWCASWLRDTHSRINPVACNHQLTLGKRLQRYSRAIKVDPPDSLYYSCHA